MASLGRAVETAAAASAVPASKNGVLLDVQQATIDVVLSAVKAVGKERAVGVSIDTSIVELGLDSVERMDIINSLEEIYGGRFPEEVLPTIETVCEVAAAVEMYLGKANLKSPADAFASCRRPTTSSNTFRKLRSSGLRFNKSPMRA